MFGRGAYFKVLEDSHQKRYGILQHLWIQYEYRGMGLSTKIMQEIEKTARLLNCVAIDLETEEFFGHWLYSKLRYETIAEIPHRILVGNQDYKGYFMRKLMADII